MQGRLDVLGPQRLLDGGSVVAVEPRGEVHPEVGEEADRDVGCGDLLVPVGPHRATLELGGAGEVRLNRRRAVELVVVNAGDERLVALEHDARHTRECVFIGDLGSVRGRVAELLEERQVQGRALAEEVVGGRRELMQIDLQRGDRRVARSHRGRGCGARTRTFEPRSHGTRVGDRRGRPDPGG